MAKSFASVLIDTYNHERFIEQAIVSVLEQDFPATDREIIVVDDGSTDRTPEIVKKFGPRVRLLRKKNGGQASAFNAGIPECKGLGAKAPRQVHPGGECNSAPVRCGGTAGWAKNIRFGKNQYY